MHTKMTGIVRLPRLLVTGTGNVPVTAVINDAEVHDSSDAPQVTKAYSLSSMHDSSLLLKSGRSHIGTYSNGRQRVPHRNAANREETLSHVCASTLCDIL